MPAENRVLEAVDIPELNHLVDCVVFPTRGERPHAGEPQSLQIDTRLLYCH